MKKILFFALILTNFFVFAKEIANSTPEKAGLCVACHGPQGNSTNPEWPNIAGQHRAYIIKQLHDFKEGTKRTAPTMAAIVSTLNDNDIAELGAYFSKLPIAQGSTPEKYFARGEKLYKTGDGEKHITACIACHGPKGDGNAQAGFAVVSGQHALYTIQQLNAFKNKTRTNDVNGIMEDITKDMSQEDMEAVAYYMQGLH